MMPAKKVAANGDDLRKDVVALTKRVDALEASRPGRKAKPMIALKQHGVCAIDPDRDSATCGDASIFRYQMGCHGDACRAVQHASYVRRKNRRAAEAVPRKKTAAKKVPHPPAKKAPAKKAPAKKVVAKKAAPAKKIVAKRAAPKRALGTAALST
jgi:hypothetical protein